jgi:nucleotide-binding universal stress UspA family protein
MNASEGLEQPQPNINRSPPFSRILVPVDGSSASIRAGRIAIRMAAVHDLPVAAVYVVDEKTVSEIAEASRQSRAAVQSELESKGWSYLEHIAQIAENYGITCYRIVKHGTPYGQISDIARERGIDLIVIGQTGRHSSQRSVLGSVAERVVEYATCSVLVVKA